MSGVRWAVMAVAGAVAFVPACAGGEKKAPESARSASFVQVGMASWYGPGFAGKPTASGERFDPDAMTCAHPKLPFGTMLEVTNTENGKRVVVRVNDRGPFAKKRIVDVSREAAKRLGFLEKGVAKVRLEIVDGG